MKLHKIHFIAALLFVQTVFAQDLHFSQFYSTSMLVNPANTGRMKEDARLTLATRNQWAALNSNFKSSALTTDFVIKAKAFKRNKLGVGLLFSHDDLAKGAYKNSNIGIATAYHWILDKRRRHRFSIGLQGGYSQKFFNGEALLYENQNRYFVFDPTIDPSEKLTSGSNGNFSFFDVQAGAAYKLVVSPKLDLETGISLYQLRQPKETLYNDANNAKINKLGTRWVQTVSATYKFTDQLSVSPQMMYMRQSHAVDANFGAFATYTLRTTHLFQLMGGVFYRNKDAAIPFIGTRFKNLDVRFSYDATTSSARNVKGATNTTNKGVGAYELVINLYGTIHRKTPSDLTIPCEIF